MTAILIPTGSETEWLEARRAGITASEIAVVMGLSPYSSPYALYHRKLGNLPEEPENDAMALGRHMESYVAAKFAERHPEFYVYGDGRQLFTHPGRPWQMATPDRRVHDVGPGVVSVCTCHWPDAHPCIDHELGCEHNPGGLIAVLECKIDGGSDDWGDDGSDQIPVHYRCQVLWQMDVMGVSAGYVACLLWNRRQVRVYEITLGPAEWHDLDIMRLEAQLFLDRIEQRREPDVDWRPATRGALKRLHPDVEERDVRISTQLSQWYQSACRNLKAAERRKARWENEIRAQLGNGHRAIDPGRRLVVARRDVYDVKAHTRKASHVDKLVPVFKPPKEKL